MIIDYLTIIIRIIMNVITDINSYKGLVIKFI
jgi:hypothetical protein